MNIREYLADFYLVYVNDFITREAFALAHSLTPTEAVQLLQMGMKFHEERATNFKNRRAT